MDPIAQDPIFNKNSIGTHEIRMDDFSSKTVQLKTQITKISEKFWMNFPEFAN